ncbi:hypothetical protein SAMN04489867_0811 [Pedococcus dokdonensis]|uniref:Uncharacterized protein n=1 Tax=Pedococcus dokdonensis TaxID=443156 RepID=A0A1H0N4B1_9MICO|nr:hypothetical protein [Pedococcus dokdonensis]SDO87210.1 hypothetical protein SAMN04489867_0811 [Pedococcus dokdonensis]
MSVAAYPYDGPAGPAHGLSPEEIRRRCIESRAAQGLPPTVQDGAVLDRLVALLRDDEAAGA